MPPKAHLVSYLSVSSIFSVTRHQGLPPATRNSASAYTQYSILDTLVCHLCTGRRPICTFAPSVCVVLINRASEPPGLSCLPLAPMSPCQLAPSRRSAAFISASASRASGPSRSGQGLPGRGASARPCRVRVALRRGSWSGSRAWWIRRADGVGYLAPA